MPLQTLFSSTIPPPSFTPSSLLDLSIKVYLLILPHPPSQTHLSLLTTFYTFHATIFIGAPSLHAYTTTTTHLQEKCPASQGKLKPFIFDPTDLDSVRHAVQGFLGDKEVWRLDVLFLDTTISHQNGKSDGEAGDVLLSSFLLAKLLLPLMHSTASHSCHFNPSIRVVWISNSNAKEGPANIASIYHLANEFAHRGCEELEDDTHAHTLPNSNTAGVQHVVVDMAMHEESRAQRYLRALISGAGADPDREACTLLYAGLALDVRGGDYIVPWGRKGAVLDDSFMATKMSSEGPWGWCDDHTRAHW